MSKEHSTVQHAKVHEPKHITISGTGDNGKIVTPSDTTNGTSSLEYPKANKLDSGSEIVGTQVIADGSGGMEFEPVSGLVHGSMGFHGGTDTTVIAVGATYYPIDQGWGGAGIVSDHLNGMTFSSAGLVATYPGHYLINCSFSLTLAAGTNDVLQWDISIDGAAAGHPQKRYIANTSDIGSMSITSAQILTAGQAISLVIQVDVADNLTVHGFEMSAVRLHP